MMRFRKYILMEKKRMIKNKSKIKWLYIFLLMMILAVTFDQITKYLVLQNLKGKEAFSIIDGVLELQFFSNTGIAWSMLEGQILFILFTGIILLAVVLFCVIKLPDHNKFHIIYILTGILTGGAIGNMIDRIRLGYVVDFIYFSIINFPIFNVADMCIVISIIIIGILFLFVYKEEDLSFLNFKQKKFRQVK